MKKGTRPLDQSLSAKFEGAGKAKFELTSPGPVERAINGLPVHMQVMYRPGQVRVQFSRQCDALDFSLEEVLQFVRLLQQNAALAQSQSILLARDRRRAN